MDAEREHLQFLSMFFYAVGALAAMMTLIPALGLFLAAEMQQPGEPLPFALAERLGLPTAATRAGMLLRRCQGYRYCLTVAWAACLFVPIGTLLGGVTVSILKRPATQRLFAANDAPQQTI